MTSTFEGVFYRVCFVSENEVDFQYTTSKQCGSDSTRSGYFALLSGGIIARVPAK